MKILLVNTSERTGGAAVACSRLQKALCRQGVDATMLVRDRQSDNPSVTSLPSGRWKQFSDFLWERVVIWHANRFMKDNLFRVDIANTGTDITGLPEFRQADIIHLHWVNQGMLSIKNLRQIFDSGKPVVWTMHDLWPATGICHHPRDCKHYHTCCHHCPLLHGAAPHDLSYSTFKRKEELLNSRHITFVACSQWLKRQAEKSSLLQGQEIRCLPNPLDISVYKPKDKQAVRKQYGLPPEKKMLLFGSVKATDKRKGVDYLTEACRILVEKTPRLKEKIGIVTFGHLSETLENRLPFEVYSQGYIGDDEKLVDIYNAVDAFVTPSLEENLPNTIMEAMACGTPCVGFRVGGIPEMIDHRMNGYVADYKSAADLAEGIRWIAEHPDSEALARNAVRKVRENYDENIVVPKFLEIYRQYL